MAKEILRGENSCNNGEQEILLSVALDINEGKTFQLEKTILESPLGWDYLTYARHVASLALARAPFEGKTIDDIKNWITSNPDQSPLLPEEIEPIIENKLILPYSYRHINLNTVFNYVPTLEKPWTGIYMEDPNVLKWYEPNIHFVTSRIHDYLKANRGKTAGITIGKWRLLHTGHLDTLWEMRQKCDFMVVAVDPKEYDVFRIKDSFVPEYEDKISYLRALTFPDGRKIDLMFVAHFAEPETWFGMVYLPFVLTEILGKSEFEIKKLDRFSNNFDDINAFVLEQSRKRMGPDEAERRSRLFYYLSEADPHFLHKQFLASKEGYEVKSLQFQNWKKKVSSSILVKNFNLSYSQTIEK